MSNIDTLRNVLFSTLEELKSGKINVEKAKAISDVSQTIINTAKVEVDFARANGGASSNFFPPKSATTINQLPGATVTKHKLIG